MRTASIALIFFVWYIIHANDPNNEERALATITFIAGISFGIFAGISSFHTIALEFRNKTLGLLFLTRLRSSEILFGKISPLSVQCFTILIAIFPILSLSLINGGVTITYVLKCWVCICSFMYLGLSIGIAVKFWRVIPDKAYELIFLPFLWLPLGSLNFIPSKVIENEITPILFLTVQLMTLAIYFYLFTLSRISHLSNCNWEFKSIIFNLSHIKKTLDKLPEFKIIKTIKTKEIRPCNRRFPNIKDNENPYQILISFLHPNHLFNQCLIYLGLFLIILFSCLSLFLDAHPNGHPNLNFACLLLFIMELAVRFNVAKESPHQMLYDRKSRMMELLLISPLSFLSIVAGLRSFLKQRLHHCFVLLGIGYVWVAGGFIAIYIKQGYAFSDRLIICLCLFIMTFFVFYIKFLPMGIRSTNVLPMRFRSTGKYYLFQLMGFLSIPVSILFIAINFIFIFLNSDNEYNTFHLSINSSFLMCSLLCFFRGLRIDYQRLQSKRFLLFTFAFILSFVIIYYSMLDLFFSGKFSDISSCFIFFTGSILLFFGGFRHELQQWQIKRFLFPSIVYFFIVSLFFMSMYDPVFNYNLSNILLCLCFFVGTCYLSYYELYAMQYYGIWLATGTQSYWVIVGKLLSLCFLIPIVSFIAAFFSIQICAPVFYYSFFYENRMIQLAATFLLWHYLRSVCSRFAINFAHRRLCQLQSLLD